MQEVIDFPRDMVQCTDLWQDILDPAYDDKFRKKTKKNAKHNGHR